MHHTLEVSDEEFKVLEALPSPLSKLAEKAGMTGPEIDLHSSKLMTKSMAKMIWEHEQLHLVTMKLGEVEIDSRSDIIYTIGEAKTYEKMLDGAKPLKKKGMEGDYPGGNVFETLQDAKNYLAARQARLANYKPYRVLASWENDTYQIENEPFRRLKKTSTIRRIL